MQQQQPPDHGMHRLEDLVTQVQEEDAVKGATLGAPADQTYFLGLAGSPIALAQCFGIFPSPAALTSHFACRLQRERQCFEPGAGFFGNRGSRRARQEP